MIIFTTETALDDFDGAGEVFDGFAILGCVTVSCAQLVMSLSQKTAMRGKVFQLQGQAFVEVFQRLAVVT